MAEAIAAARGVHTKTLGNNGYRAVSNPSLRWQRFCPVIGDDEVKRGFLESFESAWPALAVYEHQAKLRERVLDERGADIFRWRTASRLAFGLGDEHASETGLRLHHTFGVPVIPGSALKGLCRGFAQAIYGVGGAADDDAAPGAARWLFGAGGDEGAAGKVTFHDALWVSGDGGPFSIDVATVHHPGYYQQDAPPTDWDSPTPLQYLTTVGRFVFALEGPTDGVAFCRRVLAQALVEWGIGSRTRKGYGRFVTGYAMPEAVAGRPQTQTDTAARSTASTATAAPAPPPSPLLELEVLATYTPGTGEFSLTFPEGKATVHRKKAQLFEIPEVGEKLVARCRKKGAQRVVVRYRQTHSLITVEQIIWTPPG